MKKDDVIEDKFIKFKIIEDYLTRLWYDYIISTSKDLVF